MELGEIKQEYSEKKIRERIKAKIEKKEIKQADIIARTGIDKSVISRQLSNDASKFEPKALINILAGLRMDSKCILFDENKPGFNHSLSEMERVVIMADLEKAVFSYCKEEVELTYDNDRTVKILNLCFCIKNARPSDYETMAKKMGIEGRTLRRYKCGDVRVPVDMLMKLSQLLELDINYLLWGVECLPLIYPETEEERAKSEKIEKVLSVFKEMFDSRKS